MKNLILATTLTLSCFVAQAREIAPKKFDTVDLGPKQKLVLISEDMTKEVDAIIKSNLSASLKVKMIKLLIKDLGAITQNPNEKGKYLPSIFCATAGEEYKTVNKDANEMAEQCSDRLADGGGDTFDQINDEYSNLNELRDQYSRILMMVVSFSM